MNMVPLTLAPLLCICLAGQAVEHNGGRAAVLGGPGAESQPLSEVFTPGFGDSIWSFYFIEDQGLYGVEFDGDCFYVAGANALGDSHKVYVFDRLGNYLREFGQKNSGGGWGWWDLAYWDEKDQFFGSDDTLITAFDMFGTILYEVRGPYSYHKALGWDGEHLWVGYESLPVVEIDLTGNIVASYANSYTVKGLAWDNASAGNPWMWVSTQGDTWGNRIFQFDPVKGEYTGVSFPGAYATGAGGLAFSSEWEPGRAILFELCQQMPDYVVAYDLGPTEAVPNATIDLKPEVLNLKSRGRWVTCYIELSNPHSVEDIDRSSVRIEEIDDQVLDPSIETEGPSEIGDYDDDSIPDLMVKFNRQELIGRLQDSYGAVTVLVAGELFGGTKFEGSDSLRVIDPPESNRSTMVGEHRSRLAFDLCRDVPSPFARSTRISYRIPEALEVRLCVYDVRGRLVRILVDQAQPAGLHAVEWHGENDLGQHLPAGVYLYRLDAGNWSAIGKTTLLR